MKPNYSIGELAEDLKVLQPNQDALDNLMGSLEFSGVFSDKLLKKVFALSVSALEARSNFIRGYITEKGSNDQIGKFYAEFDDILKCYNIFSREFKAHMLGLFHTICYYSPQQK